MAGVTFLAFGNGSPDVFSTFAAMSTHSGSLAVGELIGAAGFITAVVAGSMALVRPFKVARKSFLRDVGFFVVAASFSMVFLADGHLQLWECVVMVAFYIFYVITVVVWHWYLGKKRRLKEREDLMRGHFDINISEEPENQPNNDHNDEGQAVGRRNTSTSTTAADFAALERGGSPHIVVQDEDEDDETRDRWMAEISNNMRVSRPLRRSRSNTANPIRPSLVGALEFRAVLSSLNKSRNHQDPINLRRYSDDPTYTLAQQQENLDAGPGPQRGDMPVDVHNAIAINNSSLGLPDNNIETSNRIRAVSAGDAEGLGWGPRLQLNDRGNQPDLLGPFLSESACLSVPGTPHVESDMAQSSKQALSGLSIPASPDAGGSQTKASGLTQETDPNRLAPPRESSPGPQSHGQLRVSNFTGGSPGYLTSSPAQSIRSLDIHDFHLPKRTGSSPGTPFSPYHDDPNAVTHRTRAPSLRLPPPSIGSDSVYPQMPYGLTSKAIKWWPYKVLPPPSTLASTLFPTLYCWEEKVLWEKLLGLVAAPSVFLLTITLPVVESDRDGQGDDVVDPDPGLLAPESPRSRSVSVIVNQMPPDSPLMESHDREDEHHNDLQSWNGSRTSTQNEALPLDRQDHLLRSVYHDNSQQFSSHGKGSFLSHRLESGNPQDDPDRAEGFSDPAISSPKEWNRWLVSTQIFTAPLLIAILIWANLDTTLSPRNLIVAVLSVLIGSLVIFAILLLTTTDNKPPRYRFLLCFVGFVVSIAWISTIANEVVGVLKAFGVILGISDAILGLTIFAVGNSLGDLVADITVAKLGYPVMALSACFGGPMLNILLGVGLSGMYMTLRESNGRHARHPHSPMKYKPYQIEVGETLIISGISLLVTLVGLLIVVPLNKWKMDRRIGYGLVILWSLSTLGNVVVEITGWSAASLTRL